MSDETPVPGAAANLGIINVRLVLADPARTDRRPRVGQHAQQFAVEPGGTKLLVVNTDSGQVPADRMARRP